jgi:hypothetical protein
VSETCLVSTSPITTAMITATTTASMAMVVYWRRMNATAPS